MFCGSPNILKMFQRPSWYMLSNAFSKSTKLMNNCLCHSVHCSIIFKSANIWSTHPLPLRKPACSFLSFSSTASVRCCTMIFVKILLGIDRSVIPCQLLQSLKLPFFGIFIMTPSNQSLGISFFSQMVLKSGWSILEARCGSVLKSSAFRLSWPGVFPFFRELMAEQFQLLLVVLCQFTGHSLHAVCLVLLWVMICLVFP